MTAMQEFIVNIFTNSDFFVAGTLVCVAVTVMLIVMFARKKNRDERGWKIFGKASVISFIFLVVVINIIAKITGSIDVTDAFTDMEQVYLFYMCIVQWVYNAVIIVEIAAVMIFRRLE